MKMYTHESEIFCTHGCVKIDGEELPRCAAKIIYGDVEKPHMVMIATCDKKMWKKEERDGDNTGNR